MKMGVGIKYVMNLIQSIKSLVHKRILFKQINLLNT